MAALYELVAAQDFEAGGSIREIAEVMGVSTTKVQEYGHAHGWPSPVRQAQLDAGNNSRDAFATRLATAEALLRELGLL